VRAASEFQSIDKFLLPSTISRLRSTKPTPVSSPLVNGAEGISDVDGQIERENGREHMSQRGQRTSFQLIRSLPRGLLPKKAQTKKEQ